MEDDKSVSTLVQDHLLALIVGNKLPPGEKLPSEVKLAGELHVSRNGVREAYRALAALNIVEIKNGAYPKVKAFDAKALTTLLSFACATSQISHEEVLTVRCCLEEHCSQDAAAKITDDEAKELCGIQDKMLKSLNDPVSFVRLDAAFHKLIAKISGNRLNIILLEALHEEILSSIQEGFAVQSRDAEKERIIALHQAIVKGIVSHDSKAAAQAMHEHFNVVLAALRQGA